MAMNEYIPVMLMLWDFYRAVRVGCKTSNKQTYIQTKQSCKTEGWIFKYLNVYNKFLLKPKACQKLL